MKMKDLEKELEIGNKIYKGICHDCSRHVEVSVIGNEEGKIEISGGALYKIKRSTEDIYFFKCDACFKKDKTLRNWQDCEVYSRVVGYLRPIQQWNKGKIAEYEQRVLFKNIEG